MSGSHWSTATIVSRSHSTTATSSPISSTSAVWIDKGSSDLVPVVDKLLGNIDRLALGVELDPDVGISGILDDAQQTLVSAFLDRDSLANGSVATEGLGWRHGIGLSCTVSLQRRVHRSQIGASKSLLDTGLVRDGCDVGGPCHEDTSILRAFRSVHEQKDSVDVHDSSLSCITTNLLDDVVDVDRSTITIGGDSMLSLFDLVGDLRRENSSSGLVLVEHNHGLAVNLDDAADGFWVKLNQVPECILTKRTGTTSITGLAQILAEDSDLSHVLIADKGDLVFGNLDHHTDFIAVAASTDDFNVVTSTESLAKTLDWNLNRLIPKRSVSDRHRNNISLD